MMRHLRSLALFGPTACSLILLAAGNLHAYPASVARVAPARGPAVQKTTVVETGSYSVSGQTGAAVYTYPIALPPARLQPKLSLSYSSQNPTYGTLAAGWVLGIPSVYLDTSRGRAEGNTYASSLAGGQRLVEVNEPSVSAGAQWYRVAEGDGSYTRYEHVGGTPGYWRALASNGVTYVFGDVSRARDEATRGSPGNEARWFLTKMTDRLGNEVTYS